MLELLLISSDFRLLRPVNENVPLNLLLEQLRVCTEEGILLSEVSWLLWQSSLVSAVQLEMLSVESLLL